jgi:hypothetical protein
MNNRRNIRTQGGFTSLEILGGVVVFLLLLPVLASLVESGLDSMKKRAVADHLAKVADAASSYCKEHWAGLVASTSATTAASITLNQLRADGFLPSGFQNTNAWGQTYGIYALQPATGELQTVVLTTGGRGAGEGKSFLNSDVPSCAAEIGGAGGFIPTGDVPGQPTGLLQGVYGGWSINLAATNIPNPGPGHIGALISLRDGDLGKDFLYRIEVPGHPELNEMATELDMTDHAIENVREVQFESHSLSDMGACDPSREGRVFFDPSVGLYVCRNGQPEVIADTGNSMFLKDATIVRDGDYISKPTCPPGTGTLPHIFVAPAMFAEGSVSKPLVAVQCWATDHGSRWQVHMRVRNADTNDPWVSPPAGYGRIMALVTCD